MSLVYIQFIPWQEKIVYSVSLVLTPASPHFDGLPSTAHRKCSGFELYLLMSFSSPTPVLSQLLQKMLFKFFLRYQCGLPGSATSPLCVLKHTSLDLSQSDLLPWKMKNKIKATLPQAAHLNPVNKLCHSSENIINNNHDDNEDNDDNGDDNIYLRSMYKLTSGWTRIWEFLSLSKGADFVTVSDICVEKGKHFIVSSVPR